MGSTNDAPPCPTVKVTLEVPQEHLPAFEQLVSDFNAGRVRAAAPAFDFTARDYREAAQALVHDPETTYALRGRILDDDKRDPAAALTDAEALHSLQARRFAGSGPLGAVSGGEAAMEQAGIDALKRLFQVAQGQSSQGSWIARFLLSLYNGQRFPFDLASLRCLDADVFEDCMRLLRMDARCRTQEVHTYFSNGGVQFEALARTWHMLDVSRLKVAAKGLAERIDPSGPFAKEAVELVQLLKNNR